MNFVTEIIFTQKQFKVSNSGNQYLNLKTDENFFVSCFNDRIFNSVKTFVPCKCLLKLTSGNKQNDYKKNLILLDLSDTMPVYSSELEQEP